MTTIKASKLLYLRSFYVVFILTSTHFFWAARQHPSVIPGVSSAGNGVFAVPGPITSSHLRTMTNNAAPAPASGDDMTVEQYLNSQCESMIEVLHFAFMIILRIEIMIIIIILL
jgi:hypothetical protein